MNIMLLEYDLNIVQGSTFSAQLTAKNEDGTAIDLSGYEIRGSIKSNYSDSTSLAELTLSKVVPNTDGKINVSLTASETSSFPITLAVYDIEMYSTSSGYVAKLLDGRVNVHPEVTTNQT